MESSNNKMQPAPAASPPQVVIADGKSETGAPVDPNAPVPLGPEQLAALKEEYSHIISLIHLGFLDAKDYPMIPDELLHPHEERKKMTLGEKICYNSIIVVLLLMLGVAIFYMISPCSFAGDIGKFECINDNLRAILTCSSNYTLSKGDYCDECGVVDMQKVNDPISWPMVVLILFDYNWDQQVTNPNTKQTETVKLNIKSVCTGTAVNRYTIVSSKNCVMKSFAYNYSGQLLQVNVGLNRYHSTEGSMYKIFAGLNRNQVLVNKPISISNLDTYFDIRFKANYIEYDKNQQARMIYFKMNESNPLPINEFKFHMACMHSKRSRMMFPETGLDAYMASWGKVKDKDEIMFVARNFTFANSKTGSIQLFILTDHGMPYNTENPHVKCNDGDLLFSSDSTKTDKFSLMGVYVRNNEQNIADRNPKLNGDLYSGFVEVNIFDSFENCDTDLEYIKEQRHRYFDK